MPIPPEATTEKPATCPPTLKCRDDQECVYDDYAEYWYFIPFPTGESLTFLFDIDILGIARKKIQYTGFVRYFWSVARIKNVFLKKIQDIGNWFALNNLKSLKEFQITGIAFPNQNEVKDLVVFYIAL